MKVLITGSGGFIGSHMVEVCKAHGHQTVGLQRHIGVRDGASYEPDKLYIGDLRDKEVVEKAVKSADAVIHVAGILGTQETINNPYPAAEVNVLGGLNVLEACRIWKRPMVYIAVGNHWMNNTYSITKTTTERFCLMYAKEHGVKVNVVRALNAFGERQQWEPVRKMMPSFITRALKGEALQVYGDGEQIMDFVYVKDVCEIMLEVVQSEATGQVYEAGTGIGYTVRELAEKVNATAAIVNGMFGSIEHLPMRPGEPEHSNVVASTPFPFDYTPFDEALERTVRYYDEATR